MTVFNSRYNIWIIAIGLPVLILYLFQDPLYNRFWIFPFFLLILLGLVFFTIIIVGLVKRYRSAQAILILTILTVIVAETFKSELLKSDKVLEATLKDDRSALHLTLRKNNTFQMTSVTMFSNKDFNGKYKLNSNKIIFLDKPYDNDFVPDTLSIINNKLILRFTDKGEPNTDFASFFSINLNKLKNSP